MASKTFKKSMAQMVDICIVFMLASGLTYLFMELNSDKLFSTSLPSQGGSTQSFTLNKKNTVLSIKVEQYVRVDDWSSVYGELRDAQQNTLVGFDREFWHEVGYDSEGRWEEQDTDFLAKVTVKEPGEYLLFFEAETNSSNPPGILVTVYREFGSSFMFIWMSIVGLILSIALGKIAGLDYRDLTSAFAKEA